MNIPLTRKEFYTTVFAQQFSPCGNYLVAANNYGKLAVFNVTQALTVGVSIECKLPTNVINAHEGYIYCLSSSQRYLVSGGGKEIHGWLWKDIIHMKKPQPKWTFHPPTSNPFECPETNSIVIDEANELLIAGCGDSIVYVWDINTGELKHSLKGHENYIHCVEYLQKTNQIISGSEDGTVKFWDLRTDSSVEQLEPNKLENAVRRSIGKWVSCIAKDETEDWLVVGGAAHASIWHLRSKTATAVLTTPRSCTQCVKFEDDFLLTGGSEPYVFKWSINGEMRTKFPSTAKTIYSLEANKITNHVLAVSGDSCYVDISTNFDYKAFSLTFKDNIAEWL